MTVITDLLDRMSRWDRIWQRTPVEVLDRDWYGRVLAAERARAAASPIAITHYDGPNHTPSYALALRGHVELTETGFGPPCTVLAWDQQVISAEIDGACVGVILWEHLPHNKTVFIYLGYVHPDHRGRGVYRAMWNALVVKAQEKGAVLIRGETDVRNEPMRAAAASLGRREQTIGLFFDVPPRVPEESRP